MGSVRQAREVSQVSKQAKQSRFRWVVGLVGGWSSPILQAYSTVSWSQVRVSQSESSVAIGFSGLVDLVESS